MSKYIFFIVFLKCFAIQSQDKSLTMYSFKEVEKLQKQHAKPMVVFIHTDWCTFCHGMEQNTFQNKEVIQILNTKFYFVKFNAEQKEAITFLGKTFQYKPSGNNTGIHELAEELALKKGKISYPTTILLNKKFEIDVQLDSYVKSKRFATILKKYLENR